MVLTERQIKLAEQLLISVRDKEPYLEYNQLAERIDPPMHWRQVGHEIGQVSILCHELGLPLISAKVVSKGQTIAGDGFFTMMKEIGRYNSSVPDRQQFRDELKAIRVCTEWHKLEDYLGLEIGFPSPEDSEAQDEEQTVASPVKPEDKFRAFLSAEEVPESDGLYVEGSLQRIAVNTYERNPAARRRCIEIHGTKCAICGFDFAKFYGEDFEGLIHVHHLKPLYTVGEEYVVNPETDLLPVCPNCHLALHSKANGVYTPEELRELIGKV